MTHCFAEFKTKRSLISLRVIIYTIRQRWYIVTTIIIFIFMTGLIFIPRQERTSPSNDTLTNTAEPMVVGHKSGTSPLKKLAPLFKYLHSIKQPSCSIYTCFPASFIFIISSLYMVIDFFLNVLVL
jgi:hypothetical protein